MQEMHNSLGVDDMPGVPNDFSAILFADRKNGKFVIYLRSINHVHELVNSNLSIKNKQGDSAPNIKSCNKNDNRVYLLYIVTYCIYNKHY